MIKKIVIVAMITMSVYSKDVIIDVGKILKENQAIAIDAKTNTIKYIVDILPNGEIIKTYINKGNKDNIPSNNVINTRKSHITIWDKKHIPYEQQVEKIDIDR